MTIDDARPAFEPYPTPPDPREAEPDPDPTREGHDDLTDQERGR